jgi:FPC/CPF motif-containing protein YcgG/quercetin dioxygenase-like cupin family protein
MNSTVKDDLERSKEAPVTRPAPESPWASRAFSLFEQRMLSTERPFPCIFGVDATHRGTLSHSFIPAGRERIPALSAALRDYSSRCRDLGARTSLVAFFEPDESIETMDGYKREFWRLLNGVSAGDSEPWPAGIDTETESSEWEFSCFGMSFFVVANTPLHKSRSSRYFEYFTITFQPRFVFDNLNPDTPTGKNARKIIRARLADYDSVPAHPQLGGFGRPGNREWVQYFIGDDNVPVPDSEKCPFAMSAGRRTQTGDTEMAGPEFTQAGPRGIQQDLIDLIPSQGSVELQHDQPGKVFGWHRHKLDEELFIMSGDVTLFWVGADGGYRERHCEAGACIRLPANTVHGSTAGGGGAYYIIRPQGGKTAVTTFLEKSEWPYPVAAPALDLPLQATGDRAVSSST